MVTPPLVSGGFNQGRTASVGGIGVLGFGYLGGWIYSIHVGSWGGYLTRILAFLAALLGASLPLTGYYLWIKRKLKL